MTGDGTALPRRITRPQRIAVIGTSGSGKTTFARVVAAVVGVPHIELDGLFHQANWVPAEADVFRARVSEAIAGQAWVTDGNYSGHLTGILWPVADVVVWLDYPFPLVMWRLFRRTVRRGVRREVLWNGNRESLRSNFLSRESLFLWARSTHWKHRREWPAWLQTAGARVVRLRSPREADAWLRDLRANVS